VAAGLRIFWLLVSEGIDQLVSVGQRGFLLQNGRFDGGSANGINFVLSRAAIMKRSGQRENQFENVWNVQRGELSGLSVTSERLLVRTGLFSSIHQLCRLQLP
jgi:hypothetical protein